MNYVNLVGRLNVKEEGMSLLDILALGAADADHFYLYIEGRGGNYAYAFSSKGRNICPVNGMECSEGDWKEGAPPCCRIDEASLDANGDPILCNHDLHPEMSNAGPVFIIEDNEKNKMRLEKLQALVIEKSSAVRNYGRKTTETDPEYLEDFT